MATKRTNSQKTRRIPKIFISWSKTNSKEFAKVLKDILENHVFENTGLQCFVSDQDIASGTDWWQKIKKELRECKLGIICMTKENLREPWIYYEAGAMIAREIPSIPLLVSCNVNALFGTPLKSNQAVDFYDSKRFLKMLNDINDIMEFGFSRNQINQLGKVAYLKMKQDMSTLLSDLTNMRVFNDKYVYPCDVNYVKRDTIFISAPMSSINNDKYNELREQLFKIKDTLLSIGFTEVYCPLIDIDSPAHFDGKTKAIKNNFPLLKQIDSMLVIYPWNVVSSCLVEMGYGIALTKRMVIFYNDSLPYMLDEAGSSIANVKTYHFSSYDEIDDIVRRNGMALFEGAFDE